MGQQQTARMSLVVTIFVLYTISETMGDLIITGHETPVYVRYSRYILCTWNGIENITKLEWYLVGLEGLPLAIMVSHDVAVLITGRVSDMSWNGRKFQCVATTISGGTVTKTISLWVKEPPLLNKLLFFTRQVNEKLHVDLSDGHLPAFPFPTFKWSRPGGEAVVNTTERVYGYPSVSIDSVQPSDRGSYNLTAMNYLHDGITLVGNVTGSFYVDVLFGASLIRGDRSVSVLEEKPVSLLCGRELKGNPDPQVEWRNKDGVAISDGVSRFTYNVSRGEVRLTISVTDRKDIGSWICRAQVLHQMVKVGNAVEYSIQLVVVVPPVAPEDLAILSQGNTWISFSWQQNQSSRAISPLSHHIILVSVNESEWNVTVEGSQPHANVTGLQSGIEYSFQVVAVSTSDGVSANSPASTVLMATTKFTNASSITFPYFQSTCLPLGLTIVVSLHCFLIVAVFILLLYLFIRWSWRQGFTSNHDKTN